MKNFLLTIFILSIVNLCKGQKIIVSEVDKFTHQKRIETNWVGIRRTISIGLGLKLRCVDSTYFININGNDIVEVLKPEQQALFLLDNDSTISVYSTGLQTYDIDAGYKSVEKKFNYQYTITLNDIQQLSQHSLKSVRMYWSDSYWDMDVSKQTKDKSKRALHGFLK